MMDYKLIAAIVLVVVFAYRTVINLLDWRSMKNPVPDNVKDVFDAETYAKWRSYHTEKARVHFIMSLVSFAVEMVLFLCNIYAMFAGLFPETPFRAMFAVLLLNAVSELVTIPFTYYDTMNIEEKYGFNRTGKKTFWTDKVKEFLISLILMTGIGWLLMALHTALGDWLIVTFAAAMTVIVLLIAFLYPFFSKIFNKFTPLEDGELKEKLTALLEKNGYTVRAINVMDASRRSSKLNAYFSGFGKMKTIVLYDTLKEAMTTDEICAVFAHEMGHGLHKDTLKNQIITAVQMVVLSVLAWLTVRTTGIFADFGFEGVNYGFALLLIVSVEYALIAPLFGLLTSFLSRRAEYRADAQAVKEGYGDALVNALKVLARENYANLSPDPIVVALEYSHPTLSDRIKAIQQQGSACD